MSRLSGIEPTITVRCPGHMTSAGMRQPVIARAAKAAHGWVVDFPYGEETQPIDERDRPLEGYLAIAAIAGVPGDASRSRVRLSCPGCRRNTPVKSREALYEALDLLAATGLGKVDLTTVQRALASIAAKNATLDTTRQDET